MSDTDDNYVGILLDEIRDQNKAVLEAVGDMRQELKRVPKREEFDDLKQDVKTIKTAVKATNKDLANLDARVTILEHVSA
jgi:hypothetical protein